MTLYWLGWLLWLWCDTATRGVQQQIQAGRHLSGENRDMIVLAPILLMSAFYPVVMVIASVVRLARTLL